MGKLPNPLEHRQSDHEILDLFMQRWSPRALSGEPITEAELSRLFEAARWAPSTYNEQEWRFLYAHRDSEHWQTFFDLLMEANQEWCKNAAVLIVALSKKTFSRNGKPNPVHSIDCGMALQNLMLQAATMENVLTHGMAGFNRSAARDALKVPDDYEIECMIAVGRPGDPDDLSDEMKEREVPSDRKKISEFAKPGLFSF